MELIGERGAAGVTVDEIAAAAGVSKGTVYYNFGSKSDLIAQLLRHGVDILLARLLSVRDGSGGPARRDGGDDRPGHGLHGRVPVLRPAVGQRELADPQRMAGHLRRAPRPAAGSDRRGDRGRGGRLPGGSAVSRGSLETAIFGACFVVGLDRQTYNPERTREQSVAAIMAIMRGYVVKQPHLGDD